jgi:soluble lytic murein transglycosylase-like protein
MSQILDRSFNKTGRNLRDGLGRFYNECQGEKKRQDDVTPENVQFVNTIYRQYVQSSTQVQLDRFDLDRIGPPQRERSSTSWKRILKKKCAQCVPLLEETLKAYDDSPYFVDPLLFIALIRKESSFDPLAVSHVGAGGLLQIMPKTGKDLGMNNIFDPPYFEEAFALLKKERRYRKQALRALAMITDPGDTTVAQKARDHMKEAFLLKAQREKLFDRYRSELLTHRDDDRLQPNFAIEFGYKYFSSLMKSQKGDISLALASYNAGPHRVATYGGIPPFRETVNFRNRVLKYYRQYRRMAESEYAKNP